MLTLKLMYIVTRLASSVPATSASAVMVSSMVVHVVDLISYVNSSVKNSNTVGCTFRITLEVEVVKRPV